MRKIINDVTGTIFQNQKHINMKSAFFLLTVLFYLNPTIGYSVSIKIFLSQNYPASMQDDTTKEVFTIVEEMPVYTGGNEAMTEYLKSNIVYPEQAIKDGIQGKVFVTFVVDKAGAVTEVRVLRGVSEELNAEAVRVVSGMPKWIPGKQRGEFVNVQYNLPINFMLNPVK